MSEDKLDNDKLSKGGKVILAMCMSSQYIGYLESEVPEAKIMIDENNVLSVKQLKKALNGAQKDLDTPNNTLKRVCEISVHDEEYQKWEKEMEFTCEKCQYQPTETRKLSKYHPKYYTEFEKYDDGRMPEIERVRCPSCNFEYFQSSGYDENPEEGLR